MVTLNSFALDLAQLTAVRQQKIRRMAVELPFCAHAHVWVHVYVIQKRQEKGLWKLRYHSNLVTFKKIIFASQTPKVISPSYFSSRSDWT